MAATRLAIRKSGPRPSAVRAGCAVAPACAALIAALLAGRPGAARADGQPPAPAPVAAEERTLDIGEYQVRGASQLSQREVEVALAPFLGPGRRLSDVEAARAALEKRYADRGYQSTSVAIPPQTVRGGVVVLQVAEGRVGRLRVQGARWFSPRDVKRLAPSVAEGRVPDFEAIARDVVALNQLPDRRVTPALRAGRLPGTIDVDLNVEDKLPLHGSLELNDKHGRDTKPLRVAGSLGYANLFQLGHSLTLSFQFAPPSQDARALFYTSPYPDSRVASATYLARLPEVPWLTFSASGTWQDSAVDPAGAVSVEASGLILDLRATMTLPGGDSYFHTIAVGPGYKRLGQALSVDKLRLTAPIDYAPVAATYAGTLALGKSQLALSVDLVANLRSFSSPPQRFDDRRYLASGSFVSYRGEVSLTGALPWDLQSFTRLQGQYAADPLLPSEQFTAGGADTGRGYLTSEAVGDFGALGTLELRSPALWRSRSAWLGDWRWHLFGDGAWLGIHHALPEQQARAMLWSVGGGTRLRLFGHLGGEVEVGLPLRSEGITIRYQPRIHFRVWTDF